MQNFQVCERYACFNSKLQKSHAQTSRSDSTFRILTWRQMLSTMFWLIPNICNFCKEWQDWSSISKFSLENNPVSSICKYLNLDITPFKFKLPSTFILESFKYLQPFCSTISKNSVGTHFPWRLIFCHNVSSLLMALRSDFSIKLKWKIFWKVAWIRSHSHHLRACVRNLDLRVQSVL